MRKIVLLLVSTIAVFGAFTVPPASAHTDADANAICNWYEVVYWGPNPNHVTQLSNRSEHWWGSHQAVCIYDSQYWGDPNTNHWCLIWDFPGGHGTWIENCLT